MSKKPKRAARRVFVSGASARLLQADLDAANAEVRSLMSTVKALQLSQGDVKAAAAEAVDDKILKEFVRLVQDCPLPPGLAVTGGMFYPDGRHNTFSVSVASLKLVGEALNRLLRKGGLD